MFDHILIAPASDEAAISSLSQALQEWEPSLELYTALENPMIFEPDGTLYAVSLSETNLIFRHRTRVVRPGEGVIVPQGVPVDADPPANLVCVKHSGLAPFHFRERFIQSSGFEHIEGPAERKSGVAELIAEADARYRIPYARLLCVGGEELTPEVGLDVQLLVICEGEGEIGEKSSDEPARPVRAGDVALVPAGCGYRLVGNLGSVRLRLWPELIYESRRHTASETRGPNWSPEYGSRPGLVTDRNAGPVAPDV